MSDHTSAEIFSTIFQFLAQQPDDGRTRQFARKLWKMSQSYDFSHYQLECDEDLVRLGLARHAKCRTCDDSFTQYADRNGELPIASFCYDHS